MLVFVRIMLLFMSVLGYVFGSRRWLKISSHASYLFVLCNISLVVFFSGMVSLLEVSVAAIFIIGLLLFTFFMVKERGKTIVTINDLSIINVAFLLVPVVICVDLLQTEFVHYDNFSHWGTVVKYMLSTNAFPNAETALIEFVDYPLGASAFIYYVCKIVGNSQGIMLFGQALLIFASFYAMFELISERKRNLLYVVLALGLCTMSFFNLAIRMNNLLVDFLLPVLALAALATIYVNRNRLLQAVILVAPILGLLSVVKKTGIFFVVTCLLYFIFVAAVQYKRALKHSKTKLFVLCSSVGFISVIPMLLWNHYFQSRFAGVDTKFSISQENLEQIAATKTVEQIKEIIQLFCTTILDLKNPVAITFLALNIMGIIACVVAKYGLKKKWYLWKVLLFTDLIVAIYYVGLLGMYIFLMPLDEALRVAGLERYVCSIIIYQIGCLSFCLTLDIERSFYYKMGAVYNPRGFRSIQTKNLYQKATVFCLLLSVVILISETNGLNYLRSHYEDSLPGRISTFIKENKDSPSEDRYLVYAPNSKEEVASYYLQFAFKYHLFTPYVDAFDSVFGYSFIDQLKNYDFLILFETDQDMKYILKEDFGLVASQGVYKIEDNKLKFIN